MREALEQLLDDMGEDGLSVCQEAKDQARAALSSPEPDRLSDDLQADVEQILRDKLRVHDKWEGYKIVGISDATLAIIDRLTRQPSCTKELTANISEQAKRVGATFEPAAEKIATYEAARAARQPEAEPVAWQYRWLMHDDVWSKWIDVPREVFHHLAEIVSYKYEARPLYTSPRLDRDKVLAALKPFADAAADYDEIPGVCLTHGDVEVWQQPNRAGYRLTVDDLRRARQAADAIMRETR